MKGRDSLKAGDALVLLPSYNSGPLLVRTVLAVLEVWPDVLVITDGSTDGSVDAVKPLLSVHPGLRLMEQSENSGKGGAVLLGLRAAKASGFSHVLVMDADGQHPAASIPEFMALSATHPEAMVLGVPVFGSDAPPERVRGRKVGNWFANFETLGGGIRDSLFGFRLYPVQPSLVIMESIRTARRFDFDTELAVRLFWHGVRPINRPVPVTYPPREKGGVTHFKYLRDNLLLAGTHTRLCLGLLPRLWRVWTLSRKWNQLPDAQSC